MMVKRNGRWQFSFQAHTLRVYADKSGEPGPVPSQEWLKFKVV
jgi:hypothetical protein